MRAIQIAAILILSSLHYRPAFADSPVIGVVLNAASNDRRLCPGLLVMVIGSNFGTSNSPFVISALVNNIPVTVTNVFPNQFLMGIPPVIRPGPASLVVQVQGLRSAPYSFTLDTYAPSLFDFGFGGPDLDGISFVKPARPGEPLTVAAGGLGQTMPPLDIESHPTQSPVLVSIGGRQASAVSAVGQLDAIGMFARYLITFTVPDDMPPGLYPVTASVRGQTSNALNLPVGLDAPVIVETEDVNGAPQLHSAPNSIIQVKCLRLPSADQFNVFPATEAGGVSVYINGTPAPLFEVAGSAGRIKLLTPSDLPESGEVYMVVRTAEGFSSPFKLKLTPVAPALLTLADPSQPSRINATATLGNTSWLVIPASMADALGLPADCTGLDPAASCGQAAQPNDVVQIYASGLGKATPGGDANGAPLPTGQVAPADGSITYKTVSTPNVLIGSLSADVLFSGITPGSAGLYEVTVRIPECPQNGDDVGIQISVQGYSSNIATIPISGTPPFCRAK